MLIVDRLSGKLDSVCLNLKALCFIILVFPKLGGLASMLPRTENQLKWVVLVFTVLLWAALAPSVRPQPSPSPASESPVKQKLEEEKLRQETIKLELENKALSSRWTLLLSYSTLATVLVAIVGLIATLWRQVSESSRER